MPQSRHVPVVRATLLLAAALVATACGTGSLPTTPSPPKTAEPSPTSVPPSPSPAPTLVATATPAPGPPEATLVGVRHAADGPLPGSMGTFSWDGLVSDSGWIVPAEGGSTGARASLEIVLAPAVTPVTWRARWAGVKDGSPGDPVPGGDGGTEPIVLSAPAAPGTWSLVLETSFAGGNDASWFWRIKVVP